MQRWLDLAFALIDELIGSSELPTTHQSLLRVHLTYGREQLTAMPDHPALALPLLSHQAFDHEQAPAIPIAGACLLVYLGADLFDNLGDDELPACWQGWHPGQISLAATTMLATLPYLALAQQPCDQPRRARLSELFARQLLQMSAGQHEDLLLSGQPVSPAQCLAMLERKSGAEYALFAQAGAAAACDDPALVAEYGRFGAALGTASQIVSDIKDIWGELPSQDLLAGKRTLPVAHALDVAERPEALEQLLDQARRSPEAHPETRRLLERAGSLRYAALMAQVYYRRALQALERANPHPSTLPGFHALLEQVALLAPGRPADEVAHP